MMNSSTSIQISVVIPAKNPSEALRLTLESLSLQEFRGTFEVIVVNDKSTEWPIWISEYANVAQVVHNDTQHNGRAAACHLGTQSAIGDVILFLDADCIVPRDLLEQHYTLIDAKPYQVNVHRLQFVLEFNAQTYQDQSQDPWTFLNDNYLLSNEVSLQEKLWNESDQGVNRNIHTFRMFTGACSSISKEFYNEIGGLNPKLLLGEDTEFAYRVERHGGETVLIGNYPANAVLHIGLPATSTDKLTAVREWNGPFLAQLIPKPMYRPFTRSPKWEVPRFVLEFNPGDVYEKYLAFAVILELIHGSTNDFEVILPGLLATNVEQETSGEHRSTVLMTEWLRADGRISFGNGSDHAPYRVQWNEQIVPRAQALEAMCKYLEANTWPEHLSVICCLKCETRLEVQNLSMGRSRKLQTREVELANHFMCLQCNNIVSEESSLLTTTRTIQSKLRLEPHQTGISSSPTLANPRKSRTISSFFNCARQRKFKLRLGVPKRK